MTILRDRRLIAGILVGLAILVGYQVYAYRQQHRVAHVVQVAAKTAAKVQKLSKAQCGQTVLLYTLLNALMEDTSPRFGSPPDGPVIAGARAQLIQEVRTAEENSYKALRKQGCRINTP